MAAKLTELPAADLVDLDDADLLYVVLDPGTTDVMSMSVTLAVLASYLLTQVTAADVTIADSDAVFSGASVEEALEAIAASLAVKQPLDSDLTTIAGLTATTDNFLQAKANAWASRTVAQVSVDLQATGLVADAVGFRTIPPNSQSANYTTVASDSGKYIYHPEADTTARTWTIDSNANVAYPIGTAITFDNDFGAGELTIAITSDTLVLVGAAGTTGSRTIVSGGQGTALKVAATRWRISGTGVS